MMYSMETTKGRQMNRLQQHMIEEHGWPVERVLEGRWVDGLDTSKGRKPIPQAELRLKHDTEHSLLGPKFTGGTAHRHRNGPVLRVS